MFGISPEKLLVLVAVGFVLLGPEKMPQLARDAARMLRTLRDLAQGARTQLTSELGPEFADFDLASLNPRTAIRNALLSDGPGSGSLDPRATLRQAFQDEAKPAPVRPPAPTEARYDSDAT